MRQAIDRLGIKGSVLVTSNRKPLLKYATNNSTDTSYLINSVQKSMTAAMVMREVQKGKLKLDDPLSKFYPNVDGADNNHDFWIRSRNRSAIGDTEIYF